MKGYYLNPVNSYAAPPYTTKFLQNNSSFSPKDVYAKLLKEVKEENKEISDVGKNPYLDYGLENTNIVGYVPDVSILPLGYEKPVPPVFFNPKAVEFLDNYDLKAVIYHELVHQKQGMYELTNNRDVLDPLIDKYLGLSSEEKRIFYSLRESLCKNPILKRMLFEGEAQYFTRKAYPHASEKIMPYTIEELFYQDLISTVKFLAKKREHATIQRVCIISGLKSGLIGAGAARYGG